MRLERHPKAGLVIVDNNGQVATAATTNIPDIHLYIDCSGDLSEQHYGPVVKEAIRLAKSLGINLYFNSFSHYISDCAKLDIESNSEEDAYKIFCDTPKASGGTDFQQIWKYVNESKVRREELSLIITDFEYTIIGDYLIHPENLHYTACSATKSMPGDWLTIFAKEFINCLQYAGITCPDWVLI